MQRRIQCRCFYCVYVYDFWRYGADRANVQTGNGYVTRFGPVSQASYRFNFCTGCTQSWRGTVILTNHIFFMHFMKSWRGQKTTALKKYGTIFCFYFLRSKCVLFSFASDSANMEKRQAPFLSSSFSPTPSHPQGSVKECVVRSCICLEKRSKWSSRGRVTKGLLTVAHKS